MKLVVLLLYVFYQVFIFPAFLVLLLLSLFNKKLRQYCLESCKTVWQILFKKYNNVVWLHASSAGEIDQLVPIVERLNTSKIVVSYFSPSASYYKTLFAKLGVDFYALPFDIFFLQIPFILKLSPKTLVLSRYDVWPGYTMLAYLMGVRLVSVNLTIQKSSGRLRCCIKYFFRFLYSLFDRIFFVSNDDRILFHKNYGIGGLVSGDTRITRVTDRAKTVKQPINKLGKTLVLGSVWEKDLEVLKGILIRFLDSSDTRLIVVPHEVKNREFIQNILDIFELYSPILYSKLNKENIYNLKFRVLIVDAVGVLFDFYSVADFVYVGGGFGAGVHSVLEPSVFGIPVAFGPHYENSRDVPFLESYGLIRCVRTAEDFSRFLDDFKTHKPELLSFNINLDKLLNSII